MTGSKTSKPWACSVLFLFSWLLCMAATSQGDTITLKNGMVYLSQGAPDKDATLVYIWDGLKKTVIRDSKIEQVVGDNTYRTGEKFQLVQPLVVHAGSMPREVLSVQAGPWNDKGRRPFRYVGSRSPRPTSMEQAIIEIGPHVVKYRGVDGFWLGQVATTPGSAAGGDRPAGPRRAAEPGRARTCCPLLDGCRLLSGGPARARPDHS